MSDNQQPTTIREWPDARKYRRSIRLEFTVYMSLAVLLLMTATGFVITDKYVKTVSESVVNGLFGQARSYASSAGKHMLLAEGPDLLMLNDLCMKLTNGSDDWYWAGITGNDSSYLAHSDMRQVVTGSRLDISADRSATGEVRQSEALFTKEDTIIVMVPISERDTKLGFLVAAGSSDRINAAKQDSIFTVMSITAIMLLLGLPVTMFFIQRRLRPLRQMTDRLKEVEVDNLSIDLTINSRNELGYLAETLSVMGVRLNQAQKQLVTQERMARELEIATEIQSNMLPKVLPLDSRFEFATAYKSAREVGGDYYDFIEFGDDHLGFLVADVSGKSLPGMLVMLLTRDIVRNTARTHREPAALLSEVNRKLMPEIKKGMFVTMFYGLLDKKSGRLQFASAGHNPLIVVRSIGMGVDTLNPKGYPLGMMPAKAFDNRIEQEELILAPNDWLVQYTDGVNEAHNEQDEEYGMDRFIETLRKGATMGPPEMTSMCIDELGNFTGAAQQYDDVTLVAMKWFGSLADRNLSDHKEFANAR